MANQGNGPEGQFDIDPIRAKATSMRNSVSTSGVNAIVNALWSRPELRMMIEGSSANNAQVESQNVESSEGIDVQASSPNSTVNSVPESGDPLTETISGGPGADGLSYEISDEANIRERVARAYPEEKVGSNV